MQLCDKLLAQSDIQNEILTELQALCEKILAGNESLAELVSELQSACEKLDGVEPLLTEIKDLLTCPPAEPQGVLVAWG
jgi:uncharacterized protein Yka (UPF0111/DUF47 family)